jgi:hypothetical protein
MTNIILIVLPWFVISGLLAIIYKMWDKIDKLKDKVKTLSEFTDRDLWLCGERLKYLTPTEFEELCAKLWNHVIGCYAYTTPPTRDFGRDIVLTDNGETVFIECKHWLPNDENLQKIGREISMKLKGSMDYGLDGRNPVTRGIIMTTSTFTKDCEIYSKMMGIKLWGVNEILELIKRVGVEEVYPDLGIDYDGMYMTDEDM